MSSPLDDEEDLTPLRPAAPRAPRTPPPPPAPIPAARVPAPGPGPTPPPAVGPAAVGGADEAVTFGAVGRNAVGDFADHSGRRGLVRLGGAGVKYDPPPAEVQALHPVWSDPLKRGERFELHLDGLDPTSAKTLLGKAETLYKLGQGLVANWPERGVPEDHERCDRLDQAADGLLALVAALHRGNWRVGLLQPETVYVLPAAPGGKASVLLPDLGFTWQSKHGQPPYDGALGKPAWLDDEHRYAALWPQRPVWQQFAREWHRTPDGATALQASPDHGGGLPEALRKEDLKTVARLLAVALGAEPGKDVTPPAGKAATVWATLTRAAAGEFATADAFRAALQNAPPSEHFLGPKPAPEPAPGDKLPPPRTPWGLVTAGGLLVLAVIVGVSLISTWKPADTTAVAVTPTTPEDTSPASRPTTTKPEGMPATKPEVVDVSKPPAEPPSPGTEIAKLKERLETAPGGVQGSDVEALYRLENLTGPEREWREYLRAQFVRHADDRLGKLLDSSAVLSSRRVVTSELRKLRDDLQRLNNQHKPANESLDRKEKSCIERSERRLGRL